MGNPIKMDDLKIQYDSAVNNGQYMININGYYMVNDG